MNSLFDDIPGIDTSYEQRITSGEVIRALWWCQPYASLMLHGKEFETRSRATHVRGLVLICSTIRPYKGEAVVKLAGDGGMLSNLYSALDGVSLPNGCAIALGELVDSFPMRAEHESKAFVEYSSDRWCWKFKHVRAIEPFRLPGKQGWSIIDNETRNKIKFV